MNKNHSKVVKMVSLALIAAIEVILTLFPIQVGTISLNLGLTPIIIAAIIFGPVEGCAIGVVSGLVTAIQVITAQSPFYVFLVATNPVAAFILCIVKTALAGLAAGFIYKLFCKFCGSNIVNMAAASVVCPVVNTGIFALGMLTIFGNAMMADEVIGAWAGGAGLIFLVFVVLIGVNFFVELVLNLVVCPVIGKALLSAMKIKK